MVRIEEAIKIIQDQDIKLKTEIRKLINCLGFSISEDFVAPFAMPSFDNSAMDGYALCGIIQEYKIVGEVAAGNISEIDLKEGEAVRIFTGAKVPENTTAVMMQEKAKVNGDKLILEEQPKEGQSIRRKGGQLEEGQLVFEKGYAITPAGIGMIASLGIEKVEVYKKPVINLITTGDELITPGKFKKEGQIYESNSYALAVACEQFGFPVQHRLQIEDNFESIKSGIKKSIENTDILILSGGISVGDYDFVKQALEENGVEEQFYKVFQKPGKPLFFGRKENKFVFALPGNPASSLSCFYIYVLPFLQKFSGFQECGLPKYSFSISHDFENRSDRPSFLKAKVINDNVQILDGQGSSMIQSMAKGNALAFIDAETSAKKGDQIDCYLIS
ncbi:gephyrin-like molybdotransferase Glp [Christiangramia forsetii]|uniref:Molybdopterin molybdenumtransferase n=2 Tax=Christiangramia forsetii TaxID=411153 RepID=A0LYJ3_CHRFK|nr:gephyrin-like molybdotransferase Glp [Christiangramia forsetii]GGG34071.1 molybdopterin molybdenumtransferase [Christiangramia forsetii]CAL65438.1 molybdopterin biosynthesis protein moeA [Christiangramia forsetii KT0803]